MTLESINRDILSAYPQGYGAEEILSLDDLPSLGPCRYWRIEAPDGIFCLRRWPRNKPEVERLQFQQAVLWHSVCEGIDFVPLPFETLEHQGYVVRDGSFWELLPWIEGTEEISSEYFTPADFSAIDGNPFVQNSADPFHDRAEPFQLVSAAMSLAQFHLAVSTFPLPHFPNSTSPKVRGHLTKWEAWIRGGFSELRHALRLKESEKENRLENDWADSGRKLIDHAISLSGEVVSLLNRAVRLAVPVQTVIGNCCFRHLRFDEEGLCGMIDFKELSVDSVSLDVASLLDSMTGSNASLRTLGLKAYQSIRSLTDSELFLVKAFETSRDILEGLDYLSCRFLSGKRFDEIRLREMLRRINRWNHRLDEERNNRRSA